LRNAYYWGKPPVYSDWVVEAELDVLLDDWLSDYLEYTFGYAEVYTIDITDVPSSISGYVKVDSVADLSYGKWTVFTTYEDTAYIEIITDSSFVQSLAIAEVTQVADTAPDTFSATEIDVRFNKAVNADFAENENNYLLGGAANKADTAVLDADGKTVHLTYNNGSFPTDTTYNATLYNSGTLYVTFAEAAGTTPANAEFLIGKTFTFVAAPSGSSDFYQSNIGTDRIIIAPGAQESSVVIDVPDWFTVQKYDYTDYVFVDTDEVVTWTYAYGSYIADLDNIQTTSQLTTGITFNGTDYSQQIPTLGDLKLTVDNTYTTTGDPALISIYLQGTVGSSGSYVYGRAVFYVFATEADALTWFTARNAEKATVSAEFDTWLTEWKTDLKGLESAYPFTQLTAAKTAYNALPAAPTSAASGYGAWLTAYENRYEVTVNQNIGSGSARSGWTRLKYSIYDGTTGQYSGPSLYTVLANAATAAAAITTITQPTEASALTALNDGVAAYFAFADAYGDPAKVTAETAKLVALNARLRNKGWSE
jgi:hypothetical protein